jgi:recombination protein RecA
VSGNIIQLCELRRGLGEPGAQSGRPRWAFDELGGRLLEISGQGAAASLTVAMALVLEAQTAGEPVAWITARASTFFPPDASDSGVDLDSLAVVRVAGARAAARAAEHLVRSGAFGLVVLDLGRHADIPMPMQGRLVGLAQRHDAAVVCLTEKPDASPSIGSMVSLRAAALRSEVGPAGSDRYRYKVVVLKDKRRGPHWEHAEVVRGPAGLR